MRGRKPQPTIEKERRGNPGRRPLNPNEPTAKVGLPKCPAWLKGEERKLYNRIGRQLVAENRLAVVYQGTFIVYVQALAQVSLATERLEALDDQITFTANGYPVVSPWVGIRNKAHAMLIKAAAELGITPSSQSRVSKVATPKAQSKLELFKGGKR